MAQMTERDRLDVASEAFALIEDADPRRLGFEDTAPLLQQWAGLKPELVALGAADPDADVSAAAVGLRHAGNALFDCLAAALKPLTPAELEDLRESVSRRHTDALEAAEELLRRVA
jgi:hypothetical protein